MEFKELKPVQVITTRDFPVHSAAVLAKYFEMYQNAEGNDLPPVPLMRKDLIIPRFDTPEQSLLQEYLRQNPQAEYFLLNGSHRTTAANLTRRMIGAMILETREDIDNARQLKFKGKPYQHGLLDTIEGNIDDLVAHFRGTSMFWSVEQKTNRMIDEMIIPRYMIDHYRKDSIGN